MSKPKRNVSSAPTLRKRPAVNFTMGEGLREIAEEEAHKLRLFTAQGGEQRPRISAIFNGMVLMLQRGQLDEELLYVSACEASGLEPEPNVIALLKPTTKELSCA